MDWGIISKYFVERFWLTIKKNEISVVSINRIRFQFFSRYGWEKAHFSFSLFCFITKNKHQFCQNALMWQECPKFSLLLVLWPWAGNYLSGSSVFFIYKKKRVGQGDCQCFLLRNFDLVSKKLTHLKELEEGNHLCLSEAKNTSRL